MLSQLIICRRVIASAAHRIKARSIIKVLSRFYKFPPLVVSQARRAYLPVSRDGELEGRKRHRPGTQFTLMWIRKKTSKFRIADVIRAACASLDYRVRIYRAFYHRDVDGWEEALERPVESFHGALRAAFCQLWRTRWKIETFVTCTRRTQSAKTQQCSFFSFDAP